MSVAPEDLQSLVLTPDLLAEPVGREVFQHHPDAAFYIGVIATPGVVEDPSVYTATSRFRAKVYIDEKGFLGAESRGRRGGETDADDNRSVHFAVVENRGLDVPSRVVGCSRLILKSDENVPLPVERFFPEAFVDGQAPINSTEGSRLIARHSDPATQAAISLSLIRAMTDYSVENSKKPVYAIVERGLNRLFRRINLPTEQIAVAKRLPEYNTENMAISIHPEKIVDAVRPENHVHQKPGMEQFFGDIALHHGLGFFDRSLMEVSE